MSTQEQNTPDDDQKWNIYLAGIRYVENQLTPYPIAKKHIATIRAQLRGAFYSGAEWQEKKDIDLLNKENTGLRESLANVLKVCKSPALTAHGLNHVELAEHLLMTKK